MKTAITYIYIRIQNTSKKDKLTINLSAKSSPNSKFLSAKLGEDKVITVFTYYTYRAYDTIEAKVS